MPSEEIKGPFMKVHKNEIYLKGGRGRSQCHTFCHLWKALNAFGFSTGLFDSDDEQASTQTKFCIHMDFGLG